VFAAFGVIGLVIGIRLSFTNDLPITVYLAAALVFFAITALFIHSVEMKSTGNFEIPSGLEFPLILVLIAFAARSFVWTGVDRALDRSAYLALYVGFSAGIGKLAGGFLADRIGWLKWTLFSLAGAALLFAFARELIIPLLIGAFLLQSVTGLTISWFGRVLPDSPAFAASLALGAAVIVGGLPFAFTEGAWFGTAAILISLPISMAGYWLVFREKTRIPL
jgi:predicted membrane channel-forming protein YqfA (hemolysin III family)